MLSPRPISAGASPLSLRQPWGPGTVRSHYIYEATEAQKGQVTRSVWPTVWDGQVGRDASEIPIGKWEFAANSTQSLRRHT